MLNLGNSAYEAVQRLKNNPDWRVFTEALADQTSSLMHTAVECPPENRVDVCGYARGFRDLVSMLLLLEKPTRGGPLPRHTVKTREALNV